MHKNHSVETQGKALPDGFSPGRYVKISGDDMGKDCFLGFTPELTPLVQDFCETSDEKTEERYIISNMRGNAEVHALEIDFYLANSTSSTDRKARVLQRIYESRLDRFDYSKQDAYKTILDKSVALISSEQNAPLEKLLTEKGWAVSHFQPEDISGVTGDIGRIIIRSIKGETRVSHLLWENLPEFYNHRAGYYDLTGTDEILVQTLEKVGNHTVYTTDVHCQNNNCLRSTAGNSSCSACIDVCPQHALEIDPVGAVKILHNSCIGCGRCVSVCPNGAMESFAFRRTRLPQILDHFHGETLLVFPQRAEIYKLRLNLPDNVIPFPVDDENFLDEESLLGFCQATGKQIVLYLPDNAAHLLEKKIDLVNTVTMKALGIKAVVLCTASDQLQTTLDQIDPATAIECFRPHGLLNKRFDLAQRLEHLIKVGDYGLIEAEPFGIVNIDPDNCTLCLSCVGKCPMNALTANSEDQTLRFSSVLCVACGTCVQTCPEANCLNLEKGKFNLAPSSFQPQILAQDELFSCIVCGREFGPKKAVEKIISQMAPHFNGQPEKLKSLSCCPDCKGRIMLEQQLSTQAAGISI